MPFNYIIIATILQSYWSYTLVNSSTFRLVGSVHDYNYETLTFYENEFFSGRDQVFHDDAPHFEGQFLNDFGR